MNETETGKPRMTKKREAKKETQRERGRERERWPVSKWKERETERGNRENETGDKDEEGKEERDGHAERSTEDGRR